MTDAVRKHILTRADAAAKLRNAPTGSKFAIHVTMDVPVVDEPDKVFPHGGNTFVYLSRKEAVRIVQDLFRDRLEERGARVIITERDYDSPIKGVVTTYWIG